MRVCQRLRRHLWECLRDWLSVPPFTRAFLKSPSSRGLSAMAELLVIYPYRFYCLSLYIVHIAVFVNCLIKETWWWWWWWWWFVTSCEGIRLKLLPCSRRSPTLHDRALKCLMWEAFSCKCTCKRELRHHHHHRHDVSGVRRQLQQWQVRWRNTSLELQWFSALVHDRFPRPVRRVDWVNLGLHVLFRLPLHSVLPHHDDHRQPCRMLTTLIQLTFDSILVL